MRVILKARFRHYRSGIAFSLGVLSIAWLPMPFIQPASAELLSREGLSNRSEYLTRVETLVDALSAADRSAAPGAGPAFRSLAVTLDAALRDLRIREAGERSGKVSPPSAFAPPGSSAGGGAPKALREVPDDWLLKSLQDAREAVEDLVRQLDNGEPLSSGRIDRSVAEIAEHVSRISRPE